MLWPVIQSEVAHPLCRGLPSSPFTTQPPKLYIIQHLPSRRPGMWTDLLLRAAQDLWPQKSIPVAGVHSILVEPFVQANEALERLQKIEYNMALSNATSN